MLELKNLTVRFTGLTAVDDLSFVVNKGEVFTVMGPNGAGKTTVFNTIGGFVKSTSGNVLFKGRDLSSMEPEKIAGLGIRRTFQNNGILREMTVIENVLTGLELSIKSSFWGCVLSLPASVREEQAATSLAWETLEQMDISDLAHRPAGELSFGQQRLVEIARAMVAGAELIMLDEPAVGLSPGERLHLGTVLRGLVDIGKTILLVEHVQDLVMAVSDQVLVLNYGKKIAQCPPSEIKNNQQVLEVYLGHA